MHCMCAPFRDEHNPMRTENQNENFFLSNSKGYLKRNFLFEGSWFRPLVLLMGVVLR